MPEEVYIIVDGYPFRTLKTNAISFTYKFNKVRSTKHFFFQAGKYNFEEYELIVLPKPMIVNFKVNLIYPKYTNHKNETLDNTGDLIVPEGTKVSWTFNTRDARTLSLIWDEENTPVTNSGKGVFSFMRKVKKSSQYTIFTLNEHSISSDTLNFNLDIIPDAFPLIRIEEFKDSTHENLLYFRGFLKDDYGFSKLKFVYTIKPQGSDSTVRNNLSIAIDPHRLKQDFYHFLNLSDINLQAGDELSYYFQV